MATDLDLHRLPPSSGSSDRHALNRARAWLVCCNLDRSFATQFGRPPAIAEGAAFLPRHGREWWNGPASDPYDAGSVAFAELMELGTRWQERVVRNGVLIPDVDVEQVTREHDARFTAIVRHWQPLLDAHHPDDPACAYRARLFPFCAAYSRLVMHALGFQDAFARGTLAADNVFFVECYADARRILQILARQLAHETYYKHAFHSHFVYATFAAAFLLKLLRPALAPLLAPGQRAEILGLVREAADALGGPAAADAAHAPAQYARFLKALLAKHGGAADTGTGGAAMDTSAPAPADAALDHPPFAPAVDLAAQLGSSTGSFLADAGSSPTAPARHPFDPLPADAFGAQLATWTGEFAAPRELDSAHWWAQFAMPGWDAGVPGTLDLPVAAALDAPLLPGWDAGLGWDVPGGSAGTSESGVSAGGAPWG